MCLVFRSDCVKTVWTCSWARPARARLSCLKLCLDHALKIWRSHAPYNVDKYIEVSSSASALDWLSSRPPGAWKNQLDPRREWSTIFSCL